MVKRIGLGLVGKVTPPLRLSTPTSRGTIIKAKWPKVLGPTLKRLAKK